MDHAAVFPLCSSVSSVVFFTVLVVEILLRFGKDSGVFGLEHFAQHVSIEQRLVHSPTADSALDRRAS